MAMKPTKALLLLQATGEMAREATVASECFRLVVTLEPTFLQFFHHTSLITAFGLQLQVDDFVLSSANFALSFTGRWVLA